MARLTEEFAEENQSLLLLTTSPVIWAAHFMLSYITAAIWCAKMVGPDGSLSGARVAIAIYTVLALSGIGITGWRAWRRHRYGTAILPHDDDSPEDRHRFLGFAALLLSALSAVAVIYAALVTVFIGRCY
jgi:hypothetical protein